MQSIQLTAGSTNWNGGQRITLQAGQTATCTTLNPGQLYAVFMYNSAQNDTNGTVNIVWSNSQPPKSITVPGTTANAGLASVAFVSGTDTQTISVSLGTNAGIAQVDVWLGSVSMPIDTSGLNNQQLPIDGSEQPFNKYTRYYCVPPSSWQQLTITSAITQFISVQFTEAKAVVYVVNETSNGLLPNQVTSMGTTASAPGIVQIYSTTIQSVQGNLQGNGSQWVWMNADSQQDSQSATISLQSLS
jgi:hypothetical protein